MSNQKQSVFNPKEFKEILIKHWHEGDDLLDTDITNLILYLYHDIKSVNIEHPSNKTYHIIIDVYDQKHKIVLNHYHEMFKLKLMRKIQKIKNFIWGK